MQIIPNFSLRELQPSLLNNDTRRREQAVHAYRSAAHWTGHVLSAAGTVTACLGGIATAKALQAPTQASLSYAVGLLAGATALHLVGASAADQAAMFDLKFPEYDKPSIFSSMKWISSALTVPLVGLSTGLFKSSELLDKSPYQTWNAVSAIFAVIAAGGTHAAGFLIKLDGDLTSSYGPYFGRKGI